MGALASLKRLEALKFEFGPQAASAKAECLSALAAGRLNGAAQVLRLHEMFCFMQAWPDDAQVLARVEELLARFDRRVDFRRHAEDLADSGLAGAALNFTYFAASAAWLAQRCPDQLRIDWESYESTELLERFLTYLASYSETPALDVLALEPVDWLARLKGPQESDASFVVKRLAAIVANEFVRDELYETFNIPLTLLPGDDTPNRTRAKCDGAPVVFQTTALKGGRPVLAEELRRAPQPPAPVGRAQGERLVDLARGAMACRHRDLDAFAYADPRDVRLVDDRDGLQFALLGMIPQRRFLLEAQYGYLVLKNGVPISYGSIVTLFNSAEIAYTIFDTFRGGESGRVYARVLALAHHEFGCDTFTIDPYQLGMDNDDALASGAWWFYQKLGYRPRDKSLLRLMNQELAKMKRRPGYRSSKTILARLATDNVHLHLKKERDDVLGVLDLANVGLKITDLLAGRFGADREAGEQTLAAEAADRLAAGAFRGWTPHERRAWRRWAPLVALLDDAGNWPPAEKRNLVELIRAKGGRRESDFLRRFNDSRRLRAALVELARE